MRDPMHDSLLIDLRAFVGSSGGELTVDDLCSVPGLTLDVLTDMVAFGIVEPVSGESPSHWRFTMGAAQRSIRALRLQHDLELNPAGAALVLELLDELERTRARLRVLEQLYR